MIRSMTGYGDAERDSTAGRLRLEVKTVNHRFFNTNIKTPPGFDRFEKAIADALRAHIARGHVHAFLSIDRSTAAVQHAPSIDIEKAKGYQEALDILKDELNLPGEPDLGMMVRFTDLFRAPDVDRTAGVEPELVSELADEAGRACRSMREAEGLRLASDLEERISAIGAHLDAVEARAPERLVEHRDRLRAAVQELSEQVDVDDERMAREIAYMAEKWDINEEVVRFRSHLELFREALEGDGSETVGKRLSFLAQEMHREANTIGSKANDAALSQASIAIKEELERIREQVENVE
jgi:uncharacterized protein (TIGR00255 family)